jgi:hypothetical protein
VSNLAVVEIVSGTWVAAGSPNRKQKGPKKQKWLTKAIVRDTNSGVITWQEPLVYSPSMKLTLMNKQLSRKDPRRPVLQTLRAMNQFHGKPARDNVKVEIAQENGSSRYYFAQCEAKKLQRVARELHSQRRPSDGERCPPLRHHVTP